VNETTHSSADRSTARVLWIVLGLNAVVAASKLVVAYRYDLVSLVADGVHSVLDGSSNVVGLIGLSLASRPPDAGHPYGHRRFESLAALAIGGLIAAACFEIAGKVLAGLRGQAPAPHVTWGAAAVVAATIVINAGISRYEGEKGRQLQSALLEADAAHTRSDAYAASAVLLSFGGVALGFQWADWVGAAIVSVFVAITAWRVIKTSVLSLIDSAQLSVEDVRRAVLEVPGVLETHNIRSRGERNAIALDLHIHLDGNLSLVDAHRKTHEVERHLMSRFPAVHDVVIHTEPASPK
jgi:cation diffusion facilitator family transporter